MISKKRFSKEKLLSNTLTETLLIFLFILLTIASLYKNKFENSQMRLDESYQEANIISMDIFNDSLEVLNEIRIESNELNEKISDFEDLKYEFQDSLKSMFNELEKYKKESDKNFIDSLTARNDTLEYNYEKIKWGEFPPACVINKDGDKFLMHIYFLRDTTFIVEIVGTDKLIKLPSFNIEKGKIFNFSLNEFKKFGSELKNSKVIKNTNKLKIDYCNVNKNKNKAACLECVYAADIFPTVFFQENAEHIKIFERIKKEFKIKSKTILGRKDENLTSSMKAISDMYFFNRSNGLKSNKHNSSQLKFR